MKRTATDDEASGPKLLRYSDLKAAGIIGNRMTLRRWIAEQGFPPPLQLGPNSLAWREDEVIDWLATRERVRSPKVAEAATTEITI